MIRALIFDFNGVLADDDPIHMEAFRQVAGEEGLSFTDQEYLDTYLPLNDRDCFRLLFEKHSGPLIGGKTRGINRAEGRLLLPGDRPERPCCLRKRRSAVRTAAGRYPLAIAVGSPQKRNLPHSQTGSTAWLFFGAIVSAEDVQFGKPNPEPFLLAHAKLRERDTSLKASECVAIEDSIAGIQSAHEPACNAWLLPILTNTERLRSVNPEWIIDSIADSFPGWKGKFRSECSVAQNVSATCHLTGGRNPACRSGSDHGVRGISAARAQSLPGFPRPYGFRRPGKAQCVRQPDGNHQENQWVLFESFGFRGNTDDYYDPRNSFFNDVLDRRVGIPITLSAGVYRSFATPELPDCGSRDAGAFHREVLRTGRKSTLSTLITAVKSSPATIAASCCIKGTVIRWNSAIVCWRGPRIARSSGAC